MPHAMPMQLTRRVIFSLFALSHMLIMFSWSLYFRTFVYFFLFSLVIIPVIHFNCSLSLSQTNINGTHVCEDRWRLRMFELRITQDGLRSIV